MTRPVTEEPIRIVKRSFASILPATFCSTAISAMVAGSTRKALVISGVSSTIIGSADLAAAFAAAPAGAAAPAALGASFLSQAASSNIAASSEGRVNKGKDFIALRFLVRGGLFFCGITAGEHVKLDEG